MKELKIFVRERAVYISEDGEEVKVKAFPKNKEAEEFIGMLQKKVEEGVNEYFVGKDENIFTNGTIDNIADLGNQALKDGNLNMKNKGLMKWALDVLENAGEKGKK